MNKLLIAFVALALGSSAILTNCTANERAREYGGNMTINLPNCQKLVNATWKETDVWYLARPFRAGETPENSTFQESSTYGVYNGTIIFHESCSR